ncbi:MAG: S-layer homology domain-containing protein, partial [Thermoanaerobaculum sp.]|nr:S-layer homology domain-containing protein [Thermoanaerobaculum sp.]
METAGQSLQNKSLLALWFFALTLPAASPLQGAVFSDVPDGHPFQGPIERLYQLGITAGCATNPLRFCPDAPVTRAQMAT